MNYVKNLFSINAFTYTLNPYSDKTLDELVKPNRKIELNREKELDL